MLVNQRSVLQFTSENEITDFFGIFGRGFTQRNSKTTRHHVSLKTHLEDMSRAPLEYILLMRTSMNIFNSPFKILLRRIIMMMDN